MKRIRALSSRQYWGFKDDLILKCVVFYIGLLPDRL